MSQLEDLHKATVVQTGDWVKLTGYGMIKQPCVDHANAIDCFSRLQFTMDWEFKVHPLGSWSTLLQELLEGQGFVVSDGSYHHSSGAAALILEGKTTTIIFVENVSSPVMMAITALFGVSYWGSTHYYCFLTMWAFP